MGGILYPYQTQGLFKICAPDVDVTKFSWLRELLSGSHMKNKKKDKNKHDGWINLISSRHTCWWVAEVS